VRALGKTPLLLIAAVAALVAVGLHALDLGRGMELETVDLRFELRGALDPPADVVLSRSTSGRSASRSSSGRSLAPATVSTSAATPSPA
jgi:hypothetical protein